MELRVTAVWAVAPGAGGHAWSEMQGCGQCGPGLQNPGDLRAEARLLLVGAPSYLPPATPECELQSWL